MTARTGSFANALLHPNVSQPDGLTDGNGQPAGRRFNVLRNNVASSLGEALRTGFPVVTKLLGTENMKAIAAMYLRAHPPRSPVLSAFGTDLPEFLAGLPQLSHLGYLPDIARLELALRASYHAADAPALDPSRLTEPSPQDLTEATLSFAPSLRLVRSRWPIHAIWLRNTQHDAPKPVAEPQDVLITRREFDPVPHLLPPGGADWIAAVSKGKSLGDALDIAQTAAPDFDPASTLAILLQDNALTSLTLKDQRP